MSDFPSSPSGKTHINYYLFIVACVLVGNKAFTKKKIRDFAFKSPTVRKVARLKSKKPYNIWVIQIFVRLFSVASRCSFFDNVKNIGLFGHWSRYFPFGGTLIANEEKVIIATHINSLAWHISLSSFGSRWGSGTAQKICPHNFGAVGAITQNGNWFICSKYHPGSWRFRST